MFFKKETYENDMEILVTSANLVTFSGFILASGITANSEGKKVVLAGSLINATGNVVTETGASGSETLSSTPIGILYQTVDVTKGDMPCSLVVEGYLRKDRVIDGVFDHTLAAIKTALPKVTFR